MNILCLTPLLHFAAQGGAGMPVRAGLPVPSEPDSVVLLEHGPLGWPSLVSQVTLGAESPVLLAGRGEAAELSVLVGGVADPVHARVVPDGGVGGVDEDDLKVLVGRVLVHPVRVENAEAAALSSDLLLGSGLGVPLGLQLGDTLVDRLSVDDSLGHGPLPSSPSYSRPVDDDALLGLVAESPGLVRPARSGQPADAARNDTPSKSIHVDEKELTRIGYVIHTTKSPSDGASSPQHGDVVCVS